MKIHWKTLFIKGLTWILTEILLVLVGLDDIADYGEFVFRENFVTSSVSIVHIVENDYQPLL
jgi:hypothetical protein